MIKTLKHIQQGHLPISEKEKSDAESFFDNQITDHWLNTQEAAKYLRVSPKCLLNLTSNGKVKYYKLGRRNRYLLSDLKQLLLAEPRGGIYGY